MTDCIHHRQLCDAVKEDGNVHRCWLDTGHQGPHVCVCWHRWTETVQPEDTK